VLPDSFFHSGWIDSQTIAGSVGTASDFGYVALGNPGHAVDLGFKGQFVGGLLTLGPWTRPRHSGFAATW